MKQFTDGDFQYSGIPTVSRYTRDYCNSTILMSIIAQVCLFVYFGGLHQLVFMQGIWDIKGHMKLGVAVLSLKIT